MPKQEYVSSGKPKISGAVYRAPLKTPLPTAADEELNEAFKEMGFVSDDGVTNSNSANSEQVYAWGGTPVMTTQSEKTDAWKAKFIEALNAEVLKATYGDNNVTVTGSLITIKAGATQLSPASYVVDMIMAGGALKRVVIPVGSLSEVGDIVYKDNEPVGYELTLEAMDDGNGYTHYEYIKLAAEATA